MKPERDLKPQIQKVVVGVKEEDQREITLYPLSIADQSELSAEISEVMSILGDKGDINLSVFVSVVLQTVMGKLPKLLKIVFPAEDSDALMREITNYQLIDIIEAIYRINYEDVTKKVKGWTEKEMGEGRVN